MLPYSPPEIHTWGTQQYSQIFYHAPSGPAVHVRVPNTVDFVMHLNKTLFLPMLQKHLCIHCNQTNLTEFIIPGKTGLSEKWMWTTPFTITSFKAIMDTWMPPTTGLGIPPSLLLFFFFFPFDAIRRVCSVQITVTWFSEQLCGHGCTFHPHGTSGLRFLGCQTLSSETLLLLKSLHALQKQFQNKQNKKLKAS